MDHESTNPRITLADRMKSVAQNRTVQFALVATAASVITRRRVLLQAITFDQLKEIFSSEEGTKAMMEIANYHRSK